MTKRGGSIIGIIGRKNKFSPLEIDLDRLGRDSAQSEAGSRSFYEYLTGNPELMEKLAEKTTNNLRTSLSK